MVTIKWIATNHDMGMLNEKEKQIGLYIACALEIGSKLHVDHEGDKYIVPNVIFITDKSKYRMGTVFIKDVSTGENKPVGYFSYNKKDECFFELSRGTKLFQISGHPDFPLGEREGWMP